MYRYNAAHDWNPASDLTPTVYKKDLHCSSHSGINISRHVHFRWQIAINRVVFILREHIEKKWPITYPSHKEHDGMTTTASAVSLSDNRQIIFLYKIASRKPFNRGEHTKPSCHRLCQSWSRRSKSSFSTEQSAYFSIILGGCWAAIIGFSFRETGQCDPINGYCQFCV